MHLITEIVAQSKWRLVICLLLLGGLTFGIVSHDASWYHQPIAEVVSQVTGKSQATSDNFGNHDQIHHQRLKLKILNGSHKELIVWMPVTYSNTNAQDLRYRRGQQLLIHIQGRAHHWRLTITDLKRDTGVAMLGWLMLSCLLLILGSKGVQPLTSLLINGCLFFVAIKINVVGDTDNGLLLFSVVAILLLIITTLVLFGWTKKAAVISTAAGLGLGLALLIEVLVLVVTNQKGLKFEMMNFVTQARLPLYLAASVFGVLGAVIDVAGDITVSLFEMVQNNQAKTARQLFAAGRQVGRSVMGPLTNVLGLIFVSSTLPMMILFLRNGNSVGYSVAMIMSLGIFQTLTSGVGIALTVPITSWLASVSLTKERSSKWVQLH